MSFDGGDVVGGVGDSRRSIDVRFSLSFGLAGELALASLESVFALLEISLTLFDFVGRHDG